MPLAELARIVYFRPDTLPPGFQAELHGDAPLRHRATSRSPSPTACRPPYLEVDADDRLRDSCSSTGASRTAARVINPQLVDEQMRGGIVQGIGAALYEHCVYDDEGQLLNGNMADYLVPMAAEMPDIEVGHVETPTRIRELGAKGAGEAGTAGAPAAHHERDQRRAAPARRRADRGNADHAGARAARTRA